MTRCKIILASAFTALMLTACEVQTPFGLVKVDIDTSQTMAAGDINIKKLIDSTVDC